MTIIEQIIEELSDSDKSLTNPLLKTKILASRIGNKELMDWTNKELSGYSVEELPDYRYGKSNLMCTMHQGFNVQENVPLPLMVFPKEFVKEMIRFRFEESVQTLESLEKENKNGMIYKEFGPDMCAMLTKMALQSGQNFTISNLRVIVHVGQITQALAVIRSILLDFMLKLEQELPNLDDILKNKLLIKENVNEKIEKIYNQTIINASGTGNTITTGDYNRIKSKVVINKGNLEELQEELRKYKISEEDISEISEIVEVEEPDYDNSRFGVKVNNWIQKMISKTLEGTWQVATGAAGGVLVELIKNYYGM
jgi:hypothetical protein